MSEQKQQQKPQGQPQRQPQAAPVPWPDDPVAYLLAAGWEPLGDPRHPRTQWLDPTKPKAAETRRVKIGTKKLSNNRVEDVYQTKVTPRAFPTPLEDAVAEQLRRGRKGA